MSGFTAKLVVAMLAVAAAVGSVCADSTPVRATTWDFTGDFADGGTAAAQFSFNVYGYSTTPESATTTGGSVLPGATYSLVPATSIIPGTPPAYGVDFYDADLNLTLQLVFDSPLTGSTNPELLDLSESWECQGYACPGPEGGPYAVVNPYGYYSYDTTRYFISGEATTVPEPASLAVLGSALLGFVVVQRRRKKA